VTNLVSDAAREVPMRLRMPLIVITRELLDQFVHACSTESA
jgi:hypothetical protein